MFRRYEETHFQRAYEIETVRKLIEEAGMKWEGVFDVETGKEPTACSERFISSQENRGNKKKEEEEMSDYMVRATAADGQIRAFAITSKEMTEEARVRHNSSPIVTAALGRAMSAAAMMGSMMKGEKDLLTLQIQGDGPMHGLTVTANANGGVKGYPGVADVILPPNAAGKLNVGGAIGSGVLSVIKDMGLKDPYVGQTELQTGEIAEDLTYYFAVSEQVPSSVGLGVLMNKDNTVRQAGGFIIQLMPFTEDAVIDAWSRKSHR